MNRGKRTGNGVASSPTSMAASVGEESTAFFGRKGPDNDDRGKGEMGRLLLVNCGVFHLLLLGSSLIIRFADLPLN